MIFFFSFYIVFIVIFNGTKRHCCKLHLLNIIKKTCWRVHDTHHCMDDPFTVRAMHGVVVQLLNAAFWDNI